MKTAIFLSDPVMKVVKKLIADSNLGQLKNAIAIELEPCSDNVKQAAYLDIIDFAQSN